MTLLASLGRIQMPKKHLITLLICLTAGVAFTCLWKAALFTDAGGLFTTNPSVWSDFAMHTALVNYYAEQPLIRILTETPLMANASMPYPPLANLISAVLYSLGQSLYSALLTQSLLFSYLGFIALFLAMRAFCDSAKIAGMAVWLFILGGSLGCVRLFTADGSFWELINEGGITNAHNAGYVLTNIITNIWMPQRSFLAALPFTALYMLLFFRLAQNYDKPRWRDLILISGCAVLSFLGQAHSIIVLFLFSLTMVVMVGRRQWHLHWQLLSGFLTAAALSGWIAFLFFQSSGDMNVRWAFGEPVMGQQDSFIVYLIKNWSHILIGAGIAWWTCRRKVSLLVVAGGVLFLAGHVIYFQPWAWDNMKILVWSYFFWCGAIAIGLAHAWRTSHWGKIMTIVLTVVLCTSGTLDILGLFTRNRIEMISEAMAKNAALVREHTPQDATILSDEYLYSAALLAGRQRLCSFDGWLWSYGLAWVEPCNLKKNFQKVQLLYPAMEKFGITHFITSKPPNFTDQSFRYEAVVTKPGFYLYKVLPPVG